MTEPETYVPPGETPVARCRHCGRPFRTERLYALHLGETHRGACTVEEVTAYEDALESESDDLFVFHLKLVATLVTVFFAFSYLYVFVLI